MGELALYLYGFPFSVFFLFFHFSRFGLKYEVMLLLFLATLILLFPYSAFFF